LLDIETGRRGAHGARWAPLQPVSTPFTSNPCSNSPACLHGERIPHTFISDPSHDLTSRKKHLLIIAIFGIQAEDLCTFGEFLSASATSGMQKAVDLILAEVVDKGSS
jgi:hypothetical protein